MEFACSEEEFRVFEKMVDEDFLGSFPFFLELVLLGVKPGVTPLTLQELEQNRDEIREMGLNVNEVSLDFEVLEDIDDEAASKQYFVARDPKRFEMLKNCYDSRKEFWRDFGLFLGYPKEDIEWFVNEGEDQIDRAKQELDGDDIDFVMRFAGYVPKPEEQRLRKARQTAERNIEAVKEADKRFGSDAGRKLLEALSQ